MLPYGASGSETRSRPRNGPSAIEVHSLPAGVSLRQLREHFGQAGQVLQVLAALDSSEQGVALLIMASEQAAAQAVEMLDRYPLGNAYLHVKRADSLPNSLVNLLYSLEQPSSGPSESATTNAQAAGAAAAAYLEHQQRMQQEQRQRARQAQDAQSWDGTPPSGAAPPGWAGFDQAHGSGQGTNGVQLANGHSQLPQNGSAVSTQQRQHQQQLESDLRHLQLDQQRQQQQQAAAAAAAAAASLPPPQPPQPHQPQRPAAMSWASAAAAAPSLAALTARPQTVAASLAAAGSAAGSGSAPSSDDWQMAAGSRGRTGRRSMQTLSNTTGRASSSVSSGSPQPTNRSSGRHSEDKLSRPGGQDGASLEPTTKLWMGGIDGAASAETVRTIFGRYGPIFDYELQPATHEKGRTDQWGFVNYKRITDAQRAYETLVGEVIPELTGTRKLKLQFRPVDSRRATNRR